MFRIDEYMDSLISVLKESFEKRLLYIGLQGSYLRHEENKIAILILWRSLMDYQ